MPQVDMTMSILMSNHKVRINSTRSSDKHAKLCAGGIGKFSIFLEDRDTYRNDIPRVPTIVYCQSLCLLKLQIFSYQYASYMVSSIASDFTMISISFTGSTWQ